MVRNTEKNKKEKYTLQDLDYGKKTEKRGKCVANTVVTVIWRQTLKSGKMRNAHGRIGSMARKLKNVENETQTLYDLLYIEKH